VAYKDVLLPMKDTVVVLRHEWSFAIEKIAGIIAQVISIPPPSRLLPPPSPLLPISSPLLPSHLISSHLIPSPPISSPSHLISSQPIPSPLLLSPLLSTHPIPSAPISSQPIPSPLLLSPLLSTHPIPSARIIAQMLTYMKHYTTCIPHLKTVLTTLIELYETMRQCEFEMLLALQVT
jgi:hypothetical protein